MTTARSDRLRNDAGILRAAARLLAYEPGASVQAIADAAGVARLTVYRRYPDRDALLAALRTAVDAELGRSLDGLPPWSSGTAALGALVHALAEVAARYPVALLRYTAGTHAPPVDARIVEVLEAGQRAGVLRTDLPAATLNTALFGVLSAVLAEGARTNAETHPGAGPDAAAAAATVFDLLLPGLTATTRCPTP